MKQSILLPHSWKIPLVILLPLSIYLFVASLYYEFEISWLKTGDIEKGINFSNNNLTDEVALSGIILSMLLLAFCAERIEDEYIRNIRLRCWQWAVVANYALLLAGIWLLYGTAFIYVFYYNMLTTLLLYLILFYSQVHVLPRIFKKPAL